MCRVNSIGVNSLIERVRRQDVLEALAKVRRGLAHLAWSQGIERRHKQ